MAANYLHTVYLNCTEIQLENGYDVLKHMFVVFENNLSDTPFSCFYVLKLFFKNAEITVHVNLHGFNLHPQQLKYIKQILLFASYCQRVYFRLFELWKLRLIKLVILLLLCNVDRMDIQSCMFPLVEKGHKLAHFDFIISFQCQNPELLELIKMANPDWIGVKLCQFM